MTESTHYNRGKPFQSAACLEPRTWNDFIASLCENTTWGISRFASTEYLERRHKVESQIYKDFQRSGGRPEIQHPIYFFFGRNSNFEKHPANKAYHIYLKDLSPKVLTFTYGDSLLGFDSGYRSQSGAAYEDSRCGRLFFFNDLEQNPSVLQGNLHIEVQLWCIPDETIVHTRV